LQERNFSLEIREFMYQKRTQTAQAGIIDHHWHTQNQIHS
jgi:hypothetical protein